MTGEALPIYHDKMNTEKHSQDGKSPLHALVWIAAFVLGASIVFGQGTGLVGGGGGTNPTRTVTQADLDNATNAVAAAGGNAFTNRVNSFSSSNSFLLSTNFATATLQYRGAHYSSGLTTNFTFWGVLNGNADMLQHRFNQQQAAEEWLDNAGTSIARFSSIGPYVEFTAPVYSYGTSETYGNAIWRGTMYGWQSLSLTNQTLTNYFSGNTVGRTAQFGTNSPPTIGAGSMMELWSSGANASEYFSINAGPASGSTNFVAIYPGRSGDVNGSILYFWKGSAGMRFGTARDNQTGGFTEIARLTSNGFWGLGIPAPTVRLDVNGTAIISNHCIVKGTNHVIGFLNASTNMGGLNGAYVAPTVNAIQTPVANRLFVSMGIVATPAAGGDAVAELWTVHDANETNIIGQVKATLGAASLPMSAGLSAFIQTNASWWVTNRSGAGASVSITNYQAVAF